MRLRVDPGPDERIRAGDLRLISSYGYTVTVSQVAFAAHLGVPVQRINELIRGKRGITPETAWLLAQALDTTPEFWINLQTAHDLARSRPSRPVERLVGIS